MTTTAKHGAGLHAIITGDPVDGFHLIGPFSHAIEAIDWANFTHLPPDTWWVMPLEDPAERDDEWGEED